MRIATGLLLLAFAAGAPPSFPADKDVPKTTEDGLELRKQTKQRVVYVRPGASFAQYKRFALADCHIEFSKKWMEDYNRSVRELSRKISESDLVESGVRPGPLLPPSAGDWVRSER